MVKKSFKISNVGDPNSYLAQRMNVEGWYTDAR